MEMFLEQWFRNTVFIKPYMKGNPDEAPKQQVYKLTLTREDE